MTGVDEEPYERSMFENEREWLRVDPIDMDVDQS